MCIEEEEGRNSCVEESAEERRQFVHSCMSPEARSYVSAETADVSKRDSFSSFCNSLRKITIMKDRLTVVSINVHAVQSLGARWQKWNSCTAFSRFLVI